MTCCISLYVLLFIYYHFPALALGKKDCYFPNGDSAGGDMPCNPSAPASVCCGKGWTCLSSGVCEFNQDSNNPRISNAIGELWRGSCTDNSWDSIHCPLFCYESWSVWRRDGPQLIRSCGQENYCCQESGKNTSCCLNKLYFNLAKVKSEQTVIALSTEITRSVVVSNSSQPTSQPLSTPSTSANPASSHTTSGLLSSSTTSQSTYPPIANPTTSSDPIVENSATNKGLAAGLGLTLALAGIGGIFGLYKYHQRRRRTTKKTQTIHSRMRDLVPDQLPQHPIETNGYTEWEMSTPGNTHEAPDTAQRQASRRTRRSRLGF